jgi:hypothetical protein
MACTTDFLTKLTPAPKQRQCRTSATFWRKRTFRRGENIALDRARDLVERLLNDRAKLAASEHAAFERANPPAIDKAKQRDIEGGWL